MGIASFVLCLVSVALFRLFLPLVVLLSLPFAPEWANQGAGHVGILWLQMVMLVELIALVLGIAGALQRQRKRLFAYIGIAFSGLLLVLQYS